MAFLPVRCGQEHLLGMMARNTDADVNVIALVGKGARTADFMERI